ncbi:MAG: calcium-binding protein [Microcoleus sp. PH2017_10_PVI_O_A]|uniref:calcium-binding protein n=1 Tax=unclassified Microcoleus TaxID=2642155 RepID=UPI001DB77978|nr:MULTISPECIES: calcium-binding protein [unclassified Microcoleus]TAE83453.1 MAG: calcium-binding protein [Oscillatoriales cyanobacterium]MCC3404523.1 calcium-binding protein [Microcoleus sp. PH2017_10_PVI_O_A]MCC3458591.1 calcium-binding protein [Microcoleus sp. PH2017_11_PCY_U_A]MCC3476841.1 calcium-binding protein [Microcoleus sp. PH2017_12_PCY_D_A]MCC3526978.1 calcium-binding protein [Microcoleus sp. PH2017_21_RUC_O_A]
MANTFNLTSNSDNFTVPPGLMAQFPGGVLGLEGNDTIRGSSESEIINGNAGKDILFGGDGNDNLQGGKGEDDLSGEGGRDILTGGSDDDYIVGGDGDDVLNGGRGDDLLEGGAGNDTLSGDRGYTNYRGGTGSDVFVLRTDVVAEDPRRNSNRSFSGSAWDAILDFERSVDRIGLTGGLTEANITLIPFSFALSNVIFISGRFPREGKISAADTDVDKNSRYDGTTIQIAATGQILGRVLSVTPSDLQGRFITLS